MTTPTIFAAMAAVMNDVSGVGKHGRNTSQNFNFRGIDDVLNAIGPALRTHGVFLAPVVGEITSEVTEVGQRRTPMKSVVVTVSYTFHGPAGDSVTVTVPGEAMDSGDKAISKAMSVALRTALIQTFALPTDEKDPDADTYERTPRGEQTPPQHNGNGNGQPRPPQNGQQNGQQRPPQNEAPPEAQRQPGPRNQETPEDRLKRVVGKLLHSADQKTVDWWIGKVAEYELGDRDVSQLVSTEVREALGIGDGELTANQLVNRVRAYSAKHHSGPAHQPERPTDAAKEAPKEPAGAAT